MAELCEGSPAEGGPPPPPSFARGPPPRSGEDYALFHQPARQLRHPLDLVGDGPELLVEGDPLQLLRVVREAGLAVLLPEEARIRKPRGEDLAVAVDDRSTTIGRLDVGGAHEGVGELAVSRVAHEVLLVGPRGELDHFGRDVEIGLVEPAEQRHRPFGETGVLDHQPLVLDQRQAARDRCGARHFAHDTLALGVIDDDMAGAQLLGVVVRAADGDFTRVMEAVAHRGVAAGHPANLAFDQVFAENRDDARQRPHPAQALGRQRGGTPAHGLGPRERADDRRDRLGQHVARGAARLIDHREIRAAALHVAQFELVARDA